MSERTCSVDDCDAAVKARGMCSKHYQRVWRLGSVDLGYSPTCVECSEPVPEAGVHGPPPRYCSKRCQNRAAYVRGKANGQRPSRRKLAEERVCGECGDGFTSVRARKFCSVRCANRWQDHENPVRCSEPDCGRGVRAKGLCALHWRRLARAEGREKSPEWDDRRRANYQKRRALKASTQVEDILPAEVYARDGWVCGICEEPVDPDCAWPDPLSPSLDHVVPLAKGGTHTWANVQLAHLCCNVKKGAMVAA